MTVNIDGATGRNVVREDNTRNIFPADFEEIEDAEGLLYARETPEQGYVTGETLATSQLVAYTEDETAHFVDLGSGNELWTHDVSGYREIEIHPEFFAVSDGSSVTIYSTEDGDELVSEDLSDTIEGVKFHPDGELLCGTRASVALIDPHDGLQFEDTDSDRVDYITISPDGDTIIAHGSNVVDSRIYDKSGFVESISLGPLGQGSFTPDGGYFVVYSQDVDEVWITDPDDGYAEVASVSHSDRPNNDYLPVDNERVYLSNDDNGTFAADLETGNEVWSTSEVLDQRAINPSGEYLYGLDGDGEPVALDTEDGSTSDQHEIPLGVDFYGFARPGASTDGILTGALFYDALESEEIQLTNSTVEVVEQVDQDGEETIVNEYDQGDGGGGDWWPSAPSGPDLDEFGGQLAGFVVIALIVVSVVASVVTDFIPFLGN